MKGHRSGHPVLTCDGCYKVIDKGCKHPQVLNADGTRMDWCGLEECKVKIRAKHDPPYICKTCLAKGENMKGGCDHFEQRGRPDTDPYGGKATPNADVIY